MIDIWTTYFSEWYKIAIRGVTLPKALQCWEEGKDEKNHYHRQSATLPRKLITGYAPF